MMRTSESDHYSTSRSFCSTVMPGHSASEDAREPAYVPGIHVFLAKSKPWMAGTSPAMTMEVIRQNRDRL